MAADAAALLRRRCLSYSRADQHLEFASGIRHADLITTDEPTVTFIVDQLSKDGDISAKPMFGEYGLYRDGKMFGMIRDGHLFIKPATGGRAFTGSIEEAPPYPGAKPCLLFDADRWDDGDRLAELVRITTAELPLPKPKAPRKPKPG